jgi:activator of 2-hydroxyglutaryl-CoA dehydratase
MEELLQVKVTVPRYAQYIGAVGSALLVSGLLED